MQQNTKGLLLFVFLISVSVFGKGGAFTFTPTITIPANTYYLKTTGRVGLQLS